MNQWEQRSNDRGRALQQQLNGGIPRALLQEELLTLLTNHRLDVDDLSTAYAAIGGQLDLGMTDSNTLLLGGGTCLEFLFRGNLDLDPDGLRLKGQKTRDQLKTLRV